MSPNDYEIPLTITIVNRALSIVLIIVIMLGLIKIVDTNNELYNKIIALEKANKELESFNYISSHDLQEPLRKIQNYVSVLSKEKNLSDEWKFYLQELTETTKHMRLLIEDLLQYSRIKKIPRNYEKVNLNIIFEEVISSFKEIINEKNVNIQIEGNCQATVISFLFRQLIVNLVSNSLKFSHPDRQPQIIINSEIIYKNKLTPKLSSDTKYCHISVSDNGIGFDSQYNERIFEFFERLHGQKYSGTGLGLAICKKIVETHNGIITAKGELNKGAVFDIYIPADRK